MVVVGFWLHHEGLTEYLYICREDATGGVIGFENRSVFWGILAKTIFPVFS